MTTSSTFLIKSEHVDISKQRSRHELLGDIRSMIEPSRQQLGSAVNSALTLRYWHIDESIRTEALQGSRGLPMARKFSRRCFGAFIQIDNPLKRDFYPQMCQQEGWSTWVPQAKLMDVIECSRERLARQDGGAT